MTYEPHLNALMFPCPCGGVAVGSFALPKFPNLMTVVGTCPTCFIRGKNPTTVAHIEMEREEWIEFARTSRFIMEADK